MALIFSECRQCVFYTAAKKTAKCQHPKNASAIVPVQGLSDNCPLLKRPTILRARKDKICVHCGLPLPADGQIRKLHKECKKNRYDALQAEYRYLAKKYKMKIERKRVQR